MPLRLSSLSTAFAKITARRAWSTTSRACRLCVPRTYAAEVAWSIADKCAQSSSAMRHLDSVTRPVSEMRRASGTVPTASRRSAASLTPIKPRSVAVGALRRRVPVPLAHRRRAPQGPPLLRTFKLWAMVWPLPPSAYSPTCSRPRSYLGRLGAHLSPDIATRGGHSPRNHRTRCNGRMYMEGRGEGLYFVL
jgi:hypothetical protein